MDINIRELVRYIENQKQIFSIMPESDFNNGIIQGFNLVKTFVELYEERMGREIAEVFDGKK